MTDLLGPGEVRALAARLAIRPTKTLGQNFVHDQNTVRRIVRVAQVQPGDVVLEIGPGLGSLTLGLLEVGAEVIAVEIDPVLAAALPPTIASHAPAAVARLRVLTQDALTLTSIPGPPPTALVANLPYNVAVPILLRMLDLFPSLRSGLVMVQSEVAERLAAGPGRKAYGIPSVKLAWYAQVVRAGAVPRAVFWPVPNVDSGLVRLTRRPTPELPVGLTRADVFAVIDRAFAQRRKMMRSIMASWSGSPAEAERVLRLAGVNPTVRGETLGIKDFVRIAAARATAG